MLTCMSPRKAAEPAQPNTSILPKESTVLRLSAVVRVSRRHGRGGEGFLSPTQQRESIIREASHIGAVIVAWHDETDSVSGRTTNRPGLQAALKEAETGKSDGVIVAKVDRFARNVVEGLLAVRKLTNEGQVFIAADDNIDTRSDTKIGNMVLGFLLMMAEWQYDTICENWDDVKTRQVTNGVAGRSLYGYTKVNRRLVIEESQARWVRQIFEWRAAGVSFTKIADRLNELDVAPPRQPDRKDTTPDQGESKIWVRNHTDQIVKNRRYTGEAKHRNRDGTEVLNPDAHPAIVTMADWKRANSIMSTAPTKAAAIEPLHSGMLRCCTCGGRMTGFVTTSKRITKATGEPFSYRYYRCQGNFTWGKCAKRVMVPAAELEDLVMADLTRRVLNGPKKALSHGQSTKALEDAHRAAQDVATRIENFTDNPVNQRLKPAQYDKALNRLLDEQEDAEALVAKLEHQLDGNHLPVTLMDRWDGLDMDARRAILGRAYAVIAVKDGKGVPAADRTKMWPHGAKGCPTDLPRRGGKDNKLRPITWR
jgi:DNA invertase Pin-like site-specific DNA recombinase